MGNLNAKEVYKKAIKKYGHSAQLSMLSEESTELSLSVIKYQRNILDGNIILQNHPYFNGMIEEIADVLVMIEQFKLMYPESEEKIYYQMFLKTLRLKQIICEHKYEDTEQGSECKYCQTPKWKHDER